MKQLIEHGLIGLGLIKGEKDFHTGFAAGVLILIFTMLLIIIIKV